MLITTFTLPEVQAKRVKYMKKETKRERNNAKD
jgi:hypothetical protein